MNPESGRVDASRFALDSSRKGGEYITIAGQTIKADTVTATLYGFISNMVYSELNSGSETEVVDSNCFYAAYGAVDTIDSLVADFKSIWSDNELKWVKVALYDPTHLMGDFTVSYE